MLALRLGLRLVGGLSADIAQRIVTQRSERPYAGVADLAQRTELPRTERERLASAGALRRLAGHRHRAHWDSAGAELATPLLRDARTREARVTLAPPTLREDVLHDLARQGFSLERHPVALVRAQLRARRVRDSREPATLPAGSPVRSAGLVTVRQGPPTAHGTVFVTLEDEHGMVNVVVWEHVALRRRKALLGATLLAVRGRWEQVDGVAHLIAQDMQDLSEMLGGLRTHSRDFH
jgi:error-prone DNA polymerase